MTERELQDAIVALAEQSHAGGQPFVAALLYHVAGAMNDGSLAELGDLVYLFYKERQRAEQRTLHNLRN